MSTSSLGGVLDVTTLVSNLMSVERQPLQLLTQQQSSYNAQLSAFGTVKSDISSLQSAAGALKLASAFSVFKATPADTTMMSATADSTAVAGNYTVVVNSLASAETMVSGNQGSITAAATADGTPTGATIGAGATLTLTVGSGSPVSVSIPQNATLAQIRDAVNSSGAGVSATIVNNGASYNLVYTSTQTGVANSITATSSDTALNAIAGSGMTIAQPAADASLKINGVPVTSSSNTVTGAIQGVTLNLTKAGSTTVTVARDSSSIEGTINTFITAYNKVVTDLNSMTAKGGQLEADFSAISVENQLNGVLNTATGFSGSGGFDYLAQIGITRGTDGTLSMNTSTFETNLSSNFNGVVQLFTDGTKGVATGIYNQTNNMLDPINGLITSRTTGLTSSVKDLQDQIDAFNARMDAMQTQLTTQYSTLNATLSSMNQTLSYVAKQWG